MTTQDLSTGEVAVLLVQRDLEKLMQRLMEQKDLVGYNIASRANANLMQVWFCVANPNTQPTEEAVESFVARRKVEI